MPLTAFALVLSAAIVHATWNVLLADARDTHAAAAVTVAVGVLVFAPIAALTWRVGGAAVPYIVASSVLELLYIVALATGYARADMSFVYPIARCSAPVFVLVVGVAALGVHLSILTGGGVLLVVTGVMLVRGLRAAGSLRDLGLALAIGACIAGYTLVDKRGVAHAAPIAYLDIVLAPVALCYAAGVWRARGGAALAGAINRRTLAAGIGLFGSYALVVAALSIAPAAPVAAVRETGVVFAVGYVALRGRERVGIARLAGSVTVVAGILCIALA